MRYGIPKFFDCDRCKHGGEDGCAVLPLGPPTTAACAWFRGRDDAPDPVAEANREAMSRAVARRSRELYSSYAGGRNPLSDLSLSDWQDMIEHLVDVVGRDDVRGAIRTIRDFGANGLEVTCGSCGDTVEIDEDSDSACPSCNRPLSLD